MPSTEAKPKRTMPKGGRKGGTIFPRVPLADALKYAKKLVSKTHTGAQPEDIIHAGVVGAKGGKGNVRVSALRQYGLLTGSKKTGFVASELARKIVAAPPEDVTRLRQEAALKPTVFKRIFDTYVSDTASRAKIKQRAADLRVHPDETETCVENYVKSLELAKLVTLNGDSICHKTPGLALNEKPDDEQNDVDAASNAAGIEADANGTDSTEAGEETEQVDQTEQTATAKPRAVFNVNVTLDSSLDIEKLAKQLELLKRFGAI